MNLTTLSFTELMQQLPLLTEEEDKAWLALRFSLNHLSAKTISAVLAAAIPHWFDLGFLNALLDSPLSENEFNALISLSFIEPFPARGENAYNVHEKTRSLLLKKLWEEDIKQYKEFSRKAAAYCQKQQHQNPLIWTVEAFYHKLLMNSDKFEIKILEQGKEWQEKSELRKLDFLTNTLSELVETGKIPANVIALIFYLQGLSFLEDNKYTLAKEFFESALQQPKINEEIKADCLFGLGTAYLALDFYLQAIESVEQALKLFEKHKNTKNMYLCLIQKGQAFRFLSELTQAEETIKKALSLIKHIKGKHNQTRLRAYGIRSLGDIDFRLDRTEQAQQRYEAALALYQEIQDKQGQANCILSLGDIDFRLDRTEQAHQRYEAALALYQEIQDKQGQANCISSLGDIDFRLSRTEQAHQRYEAALAFYQEIQHTLGQANCIHSLGKIDFRLERTEQAHQRYEAALALYQEIQDKQGQAYCYWGLGLVALSIMQTAEYPLEKAVALFSEIHLAREALISSVLLATAQGQATTMENALNQLLSDKLNLLIFKDEFQNILHVCAKYPSDSLWQQLQNRLQSALKLPTSD